MISKGDEAENVTGTKNPKLDVCTVCGKKGGFRSFSKSQLKKETVKCTDCVAKNRYWILWKDFCLDFSRMAGLVLEFDDIVLQPWYGRLCIEFCLLDRSTRES